mgnify:CR=1 FL=1
MNIVGPLKRSALDSASRLWAHLPVALRNAIRRHVPRPRFRAGVLAVIHDGEGKVLLLRHRFRGALPWGLPGGWLEPGEEPRQGMCRELSEELGLSVQPTELRLLEATSRRGRPHIEFFYGLHAVVDKTVECFEFDELGWFPTDALPEGMLDEHREILERVS